MAGGHQIVDISLDASHAGWRLDRALAAQLPTLSRERLKVLTKSGALTRAGTAVRDPAIKVKGDEQYILAIPDPTPTDNAPQDIALPIVYEDEHLLVIDQPAGMVVHPAAGNWDGTMVNALLHHCGTSLSGIGGVARPGHRPALLRLRDARREHPELLVRLDPDADLCRRARLVSGRRLWRSGRAAR